MESTSKRYEGFFVCNGFPITSDAGKMIRKSYELKPYILKAFEEVIKKPLIQIKKLETAINRPDIRQRNYKIKTPAGIFTYNADELKRIPDELAIQTALYSYYMQQPDLIAADVLFLLKIEENELKQIVFSNEITLFNKRYPGGVLDLMAAEIMRLYNAEKLTIKPDIQRDSILNRINEGKGRRIQTTGQDYIRSIRETNPDFEGKGGEYHHERTGITIALQYSDGKPHKMTTGVKMHLDMFIQTLVMSRIYDYTRPIDVTINYSDLAKLRNVANTSSIRTELLNAVDVLSFAKFVISTTSSDGKELIETSSIIIKTSKLAKYDREITLTFSPDFLKVLGVGTDDDMKKHLRESINDEIYQIPQKKKISYLIGQYLTSRYYIDYGKKKRQIAVKTLLDHIPDIPNYDETAPGKAVRSIIRPFIKNLNYLTDGNNFRSGQPFLNKYKFIDPDKEIDPERLANPESLTYNEMIRLILEFEITKTTKTRIKDPEQIEIGERYINLDQ